MKLSLCIGTEICGVTRSIGYSSESEVTRYEIFLRFASWASSVAQHLNDLDDIRGRMQPDACVEKNEYLVSYSSYISNASDQSTSTNILDREIIYR